MTFVNWISVGITGVILVVGIGFSIYYKRKLRDLDGFMGIVPPEEEDNESTGCIDP